MDLNGKNVIYVGGFGGIGFESCKCLLQNEIAQLLIFDVNEDNDKLTELRALRPKAGVHFMTLDLMTGQNEIEAAIAAAHAKLGAIDVLVNGSGIMNEQQIVRTIGINLLGPIYTTLAALRFMDQSQGGNGGVILNISSIVGLNAYGAYAVYTATKYGLNGFGRALSDLFYYEKTGVALITICPCTTQTPMIDGLRGSHVHTFAERPPIPNMLRNNQTAAQCATKLVEALKMAKNGSFWITINGELKEYIYPEIL